MNKFINPWIEAQGFVDLGVYSYDGEYYELYAFEGKDGPHFGARFSNEGADYISGHVFRGEDIRPQSAPILLAMARYYRLKAEG